jgi:hypothetical protein
MGGCVAHYTKILRSKMPTEKYEARKASRRVANLSEEERLKQNALQLARYRAMTPEQQRRRNRSMTLRKAGFSDELENDLKIHQGETCGICGVKLHGNGAFKLCCDHSHNGFVPRGLLCHVCNVGLGFYEKYQKPAGLCIKPYEDYMTNSPVAQLELEKNGL